MTAARQSAETLHTRIIEELRGNIVEGRWAPGYQLARETDLAAAYGVSRMTMNKVLTQLAQEGYVFRRKRGGTFVAQSRNQSAVLEISNIAEEVKALGKTYRWQMESVDCRRLGDSELRMLGVRRASVEEEALHVVGIHYAGDAPFCLETRAINLALVPEARHHDFGVDVPGTWLLKTMPWSTARHQVRAINVAGSDARHLKLPVGAACLEILRKTEHNGVWVTYARMLYPGEAHQLVAEFEPH